MRAIAKRTALALFTTALMAAPSALAMEATQTVEREVVITQEDGSKVTRREPADTVRPGDRIVYSLDFRNTRADDASNLALAMPVPAEIRYLEGTADIDGVPVVFSADGGKTFAPRTGLTVTDADGATRPASTDDITHIRWTIASLPSGSAGQVSFKGRLR